MKTQVFQGGGCFETISGYKLSQHFLLTLVLFQGVHYKCFIARFYRKAGELSVAEEQKPRSSKERRERNNHANDIQLSPMEKDGVKFLEILNKGEMGAVVSGMEIMYVFLFNKAYQCFIHKMDAEEGRRKTWPINERNTAMMKNLPAAADHMFEIVPKPDMHPIGVMVAAEKGIISYLDITGQLPAEDMDFMSWKEPTENQS